MAKRIAATTLNASSIDIANVIRENAPLEYQNAVPKIEKATDIPKVGEVIYGYPAFANYFVSSLLNRVALVKIRSALFNNPYEELKKGYLEYGETVEEAFVQIAKVRAFDVEKAEARELKRTLPDVRTAFHVQNWRVQYPITIQDEDLRMAFRSAEGLTDFIGKILDSLYIGANYDEYLLFKYILIKSIAAGQTYEVSVESNNSSAMAVNFRATSNQLTFMSTKYNEAGVNTATPKEDQYIFMDSKFNAQFDVEVLSRAFNMDKADFMGRLRLIDDWGTFDNERFTTIQSESDMLPPVTAAELAITAKVKAVIVDREWFQVYDNLVRMTDKEVASGIYWNYFYNVWKTVSHSPFSNIVTFLDAPLDTTPDESITISVLAKDTSADATVLTFAVSGDSEKMKNANIKFIQTQALIEKNIAVHPYGAVIIPASAANENFQLVADVEFAGATTRYSSNNLDATVAVGSAFSIAKQ